MMFTPHALTPSIKLISVKINKLQPWSTHKKKLPYVEPFWECDPAAATVSQEQSPVKDSIEAVEENTEPEVRKLFC